MGEKSFPVSASVFISSSPFPFFLFASQLCLHRSDKALLRVDVTSICTSSARDKCQGNRCRIIFCQHHNPHCERSLQGQIITKDLCIFQIWPWRRVASVSVSLGQGRLEIWSWPFDLNCKFEIKSCWLSPPILVYISFCILWCTGMTPGSAIPVRNKQHFVFAANKGRLLCCRRVLGTILVHCPLLLTFQLCWIISLNSDLCNRWGQKSFSETRQLSNSCVAALWVYGR